MTAGRANNLPYRQCIGAFLINRDGRVLVGQRLDRHEPAWQLPQGGIEPNETPRQAVLRELSEEIGTDRATVIGEMPDWIAYDFPGNLVGRLWNGRYRGQNQKWFALRFDGCDAEINVAAGAHPEFRDWKWVPISALPALAVPFKRSVYEAVVACFGPLSNGPLHRKPR
ncbi:MAG: RNA pyrophosphohydrolase [Rhodospirillales bacterium]|jgi:putative (di)nucleoside polyphosphate hydrolase|nr:RNA pyrophosphohydrolase [Rhodospirillales bacterium]